MNMSFSKTPDEHWPFFSIRQQSITVYEAEKRKQNALTIWKKINHYIQYWFCIYQRDPEEEWDSTWGLSETETEQRVHLAGHILHMPKQQHPNTVMKWTPPGGCRRQGRPRKIRRQMFHEDLKNVSVPWEDVENLATDRIRWRTLVAQCARHRTWWWRCEFIHNRGICFL